MPIKGLLFDLDGTLLDTLHDLSNAMNYALQTLSMPTHDMDACRRMIGNGVRTFARRALPMDRQNLQDRVVSIMLDYYQENCMVETRIYEGMEETLRELHGRGLKLGVITNKNQHQALMVVEHFFGSDLFDAVIGVDDDTPVKPDPTGALRFLDKMKLRSRDCLFVGDSDVDIDTAANAEMPSVGVTWGFRGRQVLVEHGADHIISHPSQLLNLLA